MLSLERLGRSSKIVILLIVQLIPYREEEVRFLLGFRGRGSRTDHGLNLPKRTMNNSLLGQRTLGSLLLNRSMIHPTSKSTYIERRPCEVAGDLRRLSGPAYDNQIQDEVAYKRQSSLRPIMTQSLSSSMKLHLNQSLTNISCIAPILGSYDRIFEQDILSVISPQYFNADLFDPT
jgi:hypothetical protein